MPFLYVKHQLVEARFRNGSQEVPGFWDYRGCLSYMLSISWLRHVFATAARKTPGFLDCRRCLSYMLSISRSRHVSQRRMSIKNPSTRRKTRLKDFFGVSKLLLIARVFRINPLNNGLTFDGHKH